MVYIFSHGEPLVYQIMGMLHQVCLNRMLAISLTTVTILLEGCYVAGGNPTPGTSTVSLWNTGTGSDEGVPVVCLESGHCGSICNLYSTWFDIEAQVGHASLLLVQWVKVIPPEMG